MKIYMLWGSGRGGGGRLFFSLRIVHFSNYKGANRKSLKLFFLTLLHSVRPKLYTILAFLSAIGLNTQLKDLRKIICLRKSEVTVERISVCNVTEKMMEHGIQCLPCSCTTDVIDVTVATTTSYWFQNDIIRMLFCHGTKHNCWLFPSCFGIRSTSSFHLCLAAKGLSAACQTREPEVPDSITSPATYFGFFFPWFKDSCQLLAKVCARSTG